MKFVFLVLAIVFITSCASNEKRQPQQVIGEVGGRAMMRPESGNTVTPSSKAEIDQSIEIFRQNLASVSEPDQIKNSASNIEEPSLASYRACFKNGFKTSDLIQRVGCERYFIKFAPFIEIGLMQSEKYKALKKLNIEITQQAQLMNQKISEIYPPNTNVCMDMRRDMLGNLVRAMDDVPLRMYDIEAQFNTPREAIVFLEKMKADYGTLEKFITSTPNDRETTIRNGMKIMGANRILRDNMLNRSSFKAVKYVTLKRMSPNCGVGQ